MIVCSQRVCSREINCASADLDVGGVIGIQDSVSCELGGTQSLACNPGKATPTCRTESHAQS